MCLPRQKASEHDDHDDQDDNHCSTFREGFSFSRLPIVKIIFGLRCDWLENA